MTVFDRYLLREWLKILGLLLCATMGLLLMQALYDNFRDLLNAEAALGDILLYYAVLMPSYLTVVLPLSLLLSLLFTLGKLHRNNELTAMRAAGLNIFGVTRSLWLACALLCGLMLLLNARVAPWSDETAHALLEGFEFQAEARSSGSGRLLGTVTGVAFENTPAHRMWYINRYGRHAQRAYGVTVAELDAQRREVSRLMAREGTYDPVRRTWTFRDGREMWFDVETSELSHTTMFDEKTVLRFDEDPQLMLLIDRKPGDLSFFQLGRIVNHFSDQDSPKVRSYAVRYYGVLTETIGPLLVLALAIPFAATGVRVSPVVGVSKSFGLFGLYYILVMTCRTMGASGAMEPLWAALAPNLAMIGLAAWLFGRMR